MTVLTNWSDFVMKQSQIDKNYLERAKMRKICYDTKNVAELVFTKSISVHDDPV